MKTTIMTITTLIILNGCGTVIDSNGNLLVDTNTQSGTNTTSSSNSNSNNNSNSNSSSTNNSNNNSNSNSTNNSNNNSNSSSTNNSNNNSNSNSTNSSNNNSNSSSTNSSNNNSNSNSTSSLAQERTDALASHNNERKLLYTNGDLVWSNTVELSAQNYANTLAQNGTFTHSNNSYGENLYASSSSATLKNGVDSWISEKSAYSYASNSCVNNRVCGHYTQVIWKNTTEVGCAKAIYQTGQYQGWTVVVCQYNSAGNYIGQKPY